MDTPVEVFGRLVLYLYVSRNLVKIEGVSLAVHVFNVFLHSSKALDFLMKDLESVRLICTFIGFISFVSSTLTTRGLVFIFDFFSTINYGIFITLLVIVDS
jgi:hypothetical protein